MGANTHDKSTHVRDELSKLDHEDLQVAVHEYVRERDENLVDDFFLSSGDAVAEESHGVRVLDP